MTFFTLGDCRIESGNDILFWTADLTAKRWLEPSAALCGAKTRLQPTGKCGKCNAAQRKSQNMTISSKMAMAYWSVMPLMYSMTHFS